MFMAGGKWSQLGIGSRLVTTNLAFDAYITSYKGGALSVRDGGRLWPRVVTAEQRRAKRGWLIHAGIFAIANPLIFLLERHRGRLRLRGVLIQLTTWGLGLIWHYLRSIYQPARRPEREG